MIVVLITAVIFLAIPSFSLTTFGGESAVWPHFIQCSSEGRLGAETLADNRGQIRQASVDNAQFNLQRAKDQIWNDGVGEVLVVQFKHCVNPSRA